MAKKTLNTLALNAGGGRSSALQLKCTIANPITLAHSWRAAVAVLRLAFSQHFANVPSFKHCT